MSTLNNHWQLSFILVRWYVWNSTCAGHVPNVGVVSFLRFSVPPCLSLMFCLGRSWNALTHVSVNLWGTVFCIEYMTCVGIGSVHDSSADLNVNWNSTLRMSGSLPVLPLYAFIAWKGISVPFFNLHLGFEQCTWKSSVPVIGCTEEDSFEFS